MSLLLSLLIFLPIIAIIGVSDIGELAIGGASSTSYAANATMCNLVYSAYGSIVITCFITGAVIILGLILYAVSKSSIQTLSTKQ